jgi:hypothetical protein
MNTVPAFLRWFHPSIAVIFRWIHGGEYLSCIEGKFFELERAWANKHRGMKRHTGCNSYYRAAGIWCCYHTVHAATHAKLTLTQYYCVGIPFTLTHMDGYNPNSSNLDIFLGQLTFIGLGEGRGVVVRFC